MGEAARRAKTDATFGRIQKSFLEQPKGLVISAPMEIRGNSMTISGGLDQQELRFSLLFWDELIWPDTNLVGIGSGADAQFLIEAGLLKRPKFVFSGSGDMAKLTASLHMHAFQTLDKSAPGKWSLATGARSFLWHDRPLADAQSAIVALYRAIPVPDVDVPLAEVLEFKTKRKTEVVRLRAEIESFTQSINASESPAEDLKLKTAQIEDACNDLMRVGKEWKFPVRVADLKCSFEILPGQILMGLFGGGVVGQTINLPTVGALVGGAATVLKITGDLKRQEVRPRQTPYEYVYSFHRELF